MITPTSGVGHGGNVNGTHVRAMRTRLTEMLGIEHPVMLAGMGGVSYHALVAAVSEAGGFGTLGRGDDVDRGAERRDAAGARAHDAAVRRRPARRAARAHGGRRARRS